MKKKDGSIPPMGAEVLSDEGAVIGMVGQGGQVYARINHNSGRLLIRWGKVLINIVEFLTRLIYIHLKR